MAATSVQVGRASGAANLDAYLNWAATDQGENFAKSDPGAARTTFTSCVQGAADFGTGPMATLSPAERLGQIQRLRAILDAVAG